jgi:hypothetical protein
MHFGMWSECIQGEGKIKKTNQRFMNVVSFLDVHYVAHKLTNYSFFVNLAFNSRINSFMMNLNMVRSTTCLKDILEFKQILFKSRKSRGVIF